MQKPPWLGTRPFRELLKLDAFELLGLPQSIAVDQAQLERHYLAINRWAHPDRTGQFAAEDQLSAANLCANANTAYSVLKSFRERGELLLVLWGGKSGSDDRRTPPGFLERVFHINELLDEHPERAERFLEQLEAAVEDRHREIGRLFGLDPLPIEEIRMHLNALKYDENLLARAESMDEED